MLEAEGASTLHREGGFVIFESPPSHGGADEGSEVDEDGESSLLNLAQRFQATRGRLPPRIVPLKVEAEAEASSSSSRAAASPAPSGTPPSSEDSENDEDGESSLLDLARDFMELRKQNQGVILPRIVPPKQTSIPTTSNASSDDALPVPEPLTEEEEELVGILVLDDRLPPYVPPEERDPPDDGT